ncbi:MAG TPA: mechanosensitive ion channel family protein [Steroidobacteraceae bacterium]|jgi:small-conductance mechanosensitive channel|nr:mechanosensitive ion channel family protein [Steroidobacteraceae bacterium]
MSSTPTKRRPWLTGGIAIALALQWTLVATALQPTSKAAAPTAGKSGGPAVQPAAAQPSSLLPLASGEILTHVRRSVDWYRDLSTVEQIDLPGVDPGARGELQEQALIAVRLAFQFGKAAADILGKESQAQPASPASGSKGATAQPGAPTLAAQLQQAAANFSAQETSLKSKISDLDARLRRSKGGNARATLAAQRAGTVAALQLVQQIESNVDQLRHFQETAVAGQGKAPKGMRAQLAALEHSIPELATGEAPAKGGAGSAPPSATAASATLASKPALPNFQPQSAGIVTLIGRWFTLHGYETQLGTATKDTTALETELTATRSRLLGTVRRLVGSGLASIAGGSTAQLAGQRQTIVAATGQLTELSSVILPLSEQALTLTDAQATLQDWSHAVAAQESSVASYLGLRIGILLAWVIAVLVVAEVWRRVTFRFLPDARRRRPFLILRRMVITIALVLVVTFNLVSQFGSVATYAGFVTAGLAVALQNVILAVVAYFFLIGRYGVRVGDRVTIAGVTGRVVDVSLFRIYLLELSGPDLHSTGRMVVLSNAVLFQPTAFFKQIPGAEYLWHSVTLTIVATADVEKAYSRLGTAANKVYDTYSAAIQRQHDLAQRFIEFETAAPVPEVRVHLTDNGLECVVRYPVVPEKSARIDQQMLEALRKALEGDEQLQLIASGGMALKSDS